MDDLGARPLWSMADSELLPALDSLDAEINRLLGVRLQVIARIEESGYAQEIGARDAAELLSFRYRQDRAEAWRDVRLARALPKYEAVRTALAEGIEPAAETDAAEPDASESGDEAGREVRLLRPAHAVAIVSALERLRSRVPAEDLDVAEEQLVALAGHLSPAELRSAAKKICDLLDSDGPEPEEHKAYERESLTLTRADNGVKFKGYLANENAELLRAVVHAGARPHRTKDGEPDPRPRDRRQADALTTALTIAATAWNTNAVQTPTSPTTAPASDREPGIAGGGPAVEGAGQPVPGYGAKASITVTIDLQDLISAPADAIGTTVYGDGLSAATVRRLACDAEVIPLVLGSNSEPLDVGRRVRLVTKAIRRALNARDRGCVVCGAPPIMCDAHHLISWIDGGPTKVDNLALLCRRHHVDLHAGRWTITITNGQVQVTRPMWANPPPHRRPITTSPPGVWAGSAPSVGAVRDGSPVPPQHSRWWADDATQAAAARFAVWGTASPRETGADPPSFATV